MLQIDIPQKTWQTQYCHHKATELSKQSGIDWQALSAGDGLISSDDDDDDEAQSCVPGWAS